MVTPIEAISTILARKMDTMERIEFISCSTNLQNFYDIRIIEEFSSFMSKNTQLLLLR